MTGASALVSGLMATLARWAKLVPALLRHDTLFRYAAIAAVVALLMLVARFAKQVAGSRLPAENDSGQTLPYGAASRNTAVTGSQILTTPPAPGTATMTPTEGDPVPAIPAGRPLEGVEVEPASRDGFGSLPKGSSQ